MTEILIDPADLRALSDAGRTPNGGALRILDVRWRLDQPDRRSEYLRAHIPGAQYIDLDGDLSRHGEPEEGRHPLPTVEHLQAAARRWGINAGDTVVIYDDQGNLSAARAWWLLRAAGVGDVRLLDGGLQAWVAAGFGTETGEAPAPEAGSVELTYGAMPTLSLAEVGEFAGASLLLDARAAERYRGDVEPIDPKAGHIPGAVSAPTSANLDADGRLRPADELRTRFESLGARVGEPVGVYCGSGVAAAHEAVALAVAGFTPVLFAGSWSQWSQHDLPVATGPAPR